MSCGQGPSGELLLAAAAVAAIQIAQGKSVDEVSILGAFFTVLGDNLALLAARQGLEETAQKSCIKPADSTDLPRVRE